MRPYLTYRAVTGRDRMIAIDGSAVVFTTPRRILRIGTSPTLPASRWVELLEQDKPAAWVIDAVAEDGQEALTALYTVLTKLFADGAIVTELRDESGVIARVVPMTSMSMIAPDDTSLGPCHLSRFAILRSSGNATILEAPLASARLELPRPSMVSEVASWFGRAVIEPSSDLLTMLCQRIGILIPCDDFGASLERSAAEEWSVHDMMFQFRSRIGYHSYPTGSHFSFAGMKTAPGVDRPATKAQRIVLPRPSAPSDTSLDSVMEARRSTRSFVQDAIPVGLLGSLLWRSMRETSRMVMQVPTSTGDTVPFELKSRPIPSGGSVHEIDAYLLVRHDGEVPAGLWRYDDAGHELVLVSTINGHAHDLWYRAMEASSTSEPPPVLIILAARFDRMMWKYSSMALAAILKHVGVIYHAMYLIATDLGLGVCALGNGDSKAFSAMVGAEPWAETSVGEMLLGIPAVKENHD